MRLTKLLSIAALAVVAVLGGVIVAGVIAAATVAAWLARRFIFKSASPAAVGSGFSRGHASEASDIIDVSATEVETMPPEL